MKYVVPWDGTPHIHSEEVKIPTHNFSSRCSFTIPTSSIVVSLWGQPVLKFILCMATFQANNTITPVWSDNLCSARILFESSSPTAKIHTNTSTHTHGASFRWNKRLIHVKPKNLIKFSTFCSRNSMELNLFHQAFGPDSAMCIDDLCHNAGGTIIWT